MLNQDYTTKILGLEDVTVTNVENIYDELPRKKYFSSPISSPHKSVNCLYHYKSVNCLYHYKSVNGLYHSFLSMSPALQPCGIFDT